MSLALSDRVDGHGFRFSRLRPRPPLLPGAEHDLGEAVHPTAAVRAGIVDVAVDAGAVLAEEQCAPEPLATNSVNLSGRGLPRSLPVALRGINAARSVLDEQHVDRVAESDGIGTRLV